jgi:WD40 repeat protein
MVAPQRAMVACVLGLLLQTWQVPAADVKPISSVRLEEIGVIRGPWTALTCVSFSPDGQTVATGGADGCVRLWDSQTRALKGLLKPEAPSYVSSLAVSPDGSYLATAGQLIESEEKRHNEVRVWHLRERRLVGSWRIDTEHIASVAFAAEPNRIVAACVARGNSVAFGWIGGPFQLASWNWVTHETQMCQTDVLTERNKVAAINGDRAYAIQPSAVMCFGLPPGCQKRFTTSVADEFLHRITISPDGRTVATGSFESPDAPPKNGGLKPVKLWDAGTGKLISTIDCPDGVETFAFSHDSQLLALGFGPGRPRDERGTIHIWSVSPATRHLCVQRAHNLSVLGLAFSPDGKTLVSIDRVDDEADPPLPSIIKLWRVISSP